MNWVDKTCRLGGDLGGQAVDDNGDILDVSADVALDGVLVNQPPHVNVSATARTVECTSPQGATVTLDGSASTDPDNDIVFYAWRRDSETGPHVGSPSRNPVVTTQQARGQTTYDLRVVDSFFAADHEPVTVSVVDTTGPAISCNAPATIAPRDTTGPNGLSFRATAIDICSGVSRVAITSFACTKTSCRVELAGDTITIRDSGGVGDTISWTVSANDGAGNPAQKTCQVDVVRTR